MNKKLGDEDRRALELLLNRGQAIDLAGAFVTSGDVPPLRVQSVEKILSLLQAMPAIDPPKDLTLKTLRRIEEAGVAGGQGAGAMTPLLGDGQQPPSML